jgi:hypothetical protein
LTHFAAGTHLIRLGDDKGEFYISPFSNDMLHIVNGVGRLVDVDINVNLINTIKEAAYETLLSDGELKPFNVNQSLNPYWFGLKDEYNFYQHPDKKFWATNGIFVGFKNPALTSDLWVFCEPKTVNERSRGSKGYEYGGLFSYSLSPLHFKK